MNTRQPLSLYETLSLPQADPSIDFNSPANKIPTPVDERGLIKIPELIIAVKETVVPDFYWSGSPSNHHFYFHESWYPNNRGENANPAVFRNLPIHRGIVPRVFETWLEKITIPAEVPQAEVREYRIQAWTVARGLFKMARKSIQTERLARRRKQLLQANPRLVDNGFDGEDPIGEEIMAEIFDKDFRGFERHMEMNEKIPQEHRLIELDMPRELVARDLGKVVMKPALNFIPVVRAA
jgi:hypothetical protein